MFRVSDDVSSSDSAARAPLEWIERRPGLDRPAMATLNDTARGEVLGTATGPAFEVTMAGGDLAFAVSAR